MKKLLVGALLLVGLNSVSFARFEKQYGAQPILETEAHIPQVDGTAKVRTFRNIEKNKEYTELTYHNSSYAKKHFELTLDFIDREDVKILKMSDSFGIKSVSFVHNGQIGLVKQQGNVLTRFFVKEKETKGLPKFADYLIANEVHGSIKLTFVNLLLDYRANK